MKAAARAGRLAAARKGTKRCQRPTNTKPPAASSPQDSFVSSWPNGKYANMRKTDPAWIPHPANLRVLNRCKPTDADKYLRIKEAEAARKVQSYDGVREGRSI